MNTESHTVHLEGSSINEQVALKFLLDIIGNLKARDVTAVRLFDRLHNLKESLPKEYKASLGVLATADIVNSLLAYHNGQPERAPVQRAALEKASWVFCLGYFYKEGIDLGRHATRRINDAAKRLDIPLDNAHDFVADVAKELIFMMRLSKVQE